MNRVLNSIFFGFFLFLIIDIIFFAGIKRGYIDTLEIREFFNPFFADNQIWPMWLVAPFLGYLFLYSPYSRVVQYGYVALVASMLIFLVPSVGYFFGEMIFFEENKKMELYKKHTVTTDLYYVGRDYIYIRAPKGERLIKIEIENVKFIE